MKLKHLFSVVGVCAAVPAAATYQFDLAYGDVSFATLNGATVGQVMNPTNTNIPALSNFTVQVLLTNTSASVQDYTAGSFMLALDRGMTKDTSWNTHAAFQAVQTDLFLDTQSNPFGNTGTVTGIDNNGFPQPAAISPLSYPYRWASTPGAGTTMRPIGGFMAFGFGIGISLRLNPGQQVRLFDANLKCLAAAGGSYNGFGIIDLPGETRHNSYMARGGDNSVYYTVRSVPVPEPESWAILALGAGLIRARKRKWARRATLSGLAMLGAFSAMAGTVEVQINDSYAYFYGMYASTASATAYVYLPGTNTLVGTYVGTVGSTGLVSVSGTPNSGTYDIHIRPAGYLSQKFANQPLSSGTTTLGSGTMVGHLCDFDQDDTVSVFDYIILSKAFDTGVGDPGWDERADADGDSVISVFDYLVMADNFDLIGSHYYGNL